MKPFNTSRTVTLLHLRNMSVKLTAGAMVLPFLLAQPAMADGLSIGGSGGINISIGGSGSVNAPVSATVGNVVGSVGNVVGSVGSVVGSVGNVVGSVGQALSPTSAPAPSTGGSTGGSSIINLPSQLLTPVSAPTPGPSTGGSGLLNSVVSLPSQLLTPSAPPAPAGGSSLLGAVASLPSQLISSPSPHAGNVISGAVTLPGQLTTSLNSITSGSTSAVYSGTNAAAHLLNQSTSGLSHLANTSGQNATQQTNNALVNVTNALSIDPKVDDALRTSAQKLARLRANGTPEQIRRANAEFMSDLYRHVVNTGDRGGPLSAVKDDAGKLHFVDAKTLNDAAAKAKLHILPHYQMAHGGTLPADPNNGTVSPLQPIVATAETVASMVPGISPKISLSHDTHGIPVSGLANGVSIGVALFGHTLAAGHILPTLTGNNTPNDVRVGLAGKAPPTSDPKYNRDLLDLNGKAILGGNAPVINLVVLPRLKPEKVVIEGGDPFPFPMPKLDDMTMKVQPGTPDNQGNNGGGGGKCGTNYTDSATEDSAGRPMLHDVNHLLASTLGSGGDGKSSSNDASGEACTDVTIQAGVIPAAQGGH